MDILILFHSILIILSCDYVVAVCPSNNIGPGPWVTELQRKADAFTSTYFHLAEKVVVNSVANCMALLLFLILDKTISGYLLNFRHHDIIISSCKGMVVTWLTEPAEVHTALKMTV